MCAGRAVARPPYSVLGTADPGVRGGLVMVPLVPKKKVHDEATWCIPKNREGVAIGAPKHVCICPVTWL